MARAVRGKKQTHEVEALDARAITDKTKTHEVGALGERAVTRKKQNHEVDALKGPRCSSCYMDEANP